MSLDISFSRVSRCLPNSSSGQCRSLMKVCRASSFQKRSSDVPEPLLQGHRLEFSIYKQELWNKGKKSDDGCTWLDMLNSWRVSVRLSDAFFNLTYSTEMVSLCCKALHFLCERCYTNTVFYYYYSVINCFNTVLGWTFAHCIPCLVWLCALQHSLCWGEAGSTLTLSKGEHFCVFQPVTYKPSNISRLCVVKGQLAKTVWTDREKHCVCKDCVHFGMCISFSVTKREKRKDKWGATYFHWIDSGFPLISRNPFSG